MKKYLSMLRVNLIMNLQYRAAAYAGTATQFFWGAMSLLMFRAFYDSDPAAFPMGFSQLSSYIWMQQAFLALFFMYQVDNSIFQSIVDGNVAYELCRPMDLYTNWIVKNMSMRISRAALRSVPILIIAALLPAPYGISAPESPMAAVLFLISLVFAFLLANIISMMLYISAFYTISPFGIRMIFAVLSDFLMGGIIPLPFFPENTQKIIQLLPFGSMQNIPLRIYSGSIKAEASAQAILIQAAWIFILLFLGKYLMNRALKRVVVQGG